MRHRASHKKEELSFEKVWKMFQEADIKLQETYRKFQETNKELQETKNVTRSI